MFLDNSTDTKTKSKRRKLFKKTEISAPFTDSPVLLKVRSWRKWLLGNICSILHIKTSVLSLMSCTKTHFPSLTNLIHLPHELKTSSSDGYDHVMWKWQDDWLEWMGHIIERSNWPLVPKKLLILWFFGHFQLAGNSRLKKSKTFIFRLYMPCANLKDHYFWNRKS